jgi:hypothetical protein
MRLYCIYINCQHLDRLDQSASTSAVERGKVLKILQRLMNLKSYVKLNNEKNNVLTTIVTRCKQVRCN